MTCKTKQSIPGQRLTLSEGAEKLEWSAEAME